MNEIDKKHDFYYKIILLHVAIWCLYILYESSILLLLNAANIHWLEILLAFILNAGIFYTTALLILPKLGNKSLYLVIPAAVAVLIACYIILSALENTYLFPLIEGKAGYPSILVFFNKAYIAQHVYRATYFVGLSFGYWFAKKSIETEKKLRMIEIERYQHLLEQEELRREIAVSKLAIYRAQLNPHFLFNTLNFFYSKINLFSKELAQSIVLLSNLMRYITSESGAEELIPLNEELGLIDTYIKLNQLRFDNTLKINFEVLGIPEHKKIAPFILMTLIENAFKYGDLSDSRQPFKIKINIYATSLEARIENKIQTGEKPPGTGTGLLNLRKQLDLIYGDKYTLNTVATNLVFKCFLQIKDRV